LCETPGGLTTARHILQTDLGDNGAMAKEKIEAAKWIGVGLTLVVLAAGAVMAFATAQADIQTVKKEVASLEQKKLDKAENEKEMYYIRSSLERIEKKLDGK
jgi:hypothetical protein